ncbi:hypothetical protein MCOR24_007752 [Pyricularia oryzae]|nr:hypothetical protein MCOR24_007752 [Pyricularia oryzae]
MLPGQSFPWLGWRIAGRLRVKMKFQLACILSLMACSAAALPASTKPGTIVQDTQGVELGDGEVCKATSTEGVLACNDASGASFNIVNGERQNLRRREAGQDDHEPNDDGEGIEARSPQDRQKPKDKKNKSKAKQAAGGQNLPLRPGESCTPINNQPGVFGCQDGQGGTFNIVNGVRQKRSVAARSPKILTDSKGNKFDDSIFVVNGELIACPPNQQC